MNSGIEPELLPRTQLAFLRNGTIRGLFVSNRPPFKNITLSEAIPPAIFQGACYFKSNLGTGSLVASIGGRLYEVIPDAYGEAAVYDRTIDGDPNSASTTQAWLWQAEKWVICNDGISLPIFFDGNTSRRSIGASSQVGVTDADFVVPAVGSSVAVTLVDPYEGQFNQNVFFGTNGAIYTVLGSTEAAGQYNATIKNVGAVAGSIIPAGTNIVVPEVSNVLTTTAQSFIVPKNGQSSIVEIFFVSRAWWNGSPRNLSIAGRRYRTSTAGSAANSINCQCFDPHFSLSGADLVVPAGTTVFDSDITPVQGQVVGTLSVDFTVPAQGSSSTAQLVDLYTGPAEQAVQIDGDDFTISPAASVPGSVNIVVINRNDTAGTTVTAGTALNTIGELPIGRMGAYGLGRNWMSLTDGRSFIASDIVGSSSGTAALGFVDAVLKVTENTFLNGGGTFKVPVSGDEIRAFVFAANLDVSLGQGPLQVFTSEMVFTCNAPVDRTTWQSITNPILTQSLISNGAQGQSSSTVANSDILFRSVDGIRSLILGRRDFATWGNVPQSREVDSILSDDNKGLLRYGSSIVFDNRLLMTASPQQSGLGVFHTGIIAMNMDPISSLRGKAPSVYDGLWEGLNVLQLVTGKFNGTQRAFAFCLNDDLDTIELHEILPSSTTEFRDNGVDDIVFEIESPVVFNDGDPKKHTLNTLKNGEIYIDRMQSDVRFEVFYKPDQWPAWVEWHSWTETYNAADDPGFRPRQGIGEPTADAADTQSNRPLRNAYHYQIKLRITGSCRFLGARFFANAAPEPPFAPPKEDT